MSRIKGLSSFSSNFEPKISGPLDARTVVDTAADLVSESTWQAPDGTLYVYKGMLVSVVNDLTEINGVYRLAALPITSEVNWVKLGTGGSAGSTGGLLWYPDNSPPSVPEDGDAYYDTALGKSLVWSDGAWHTVANDGEDGAPGLPGEDGANGVTPHIDETSRNWFIGETDTGIPATGPAGEDGQDGAAGISPHIDEATGNWFIGETNTEIPAQGPAGNDGQDGAAGSNGITPHIDAGGNWFIGETDTGIAATGPTGADGQDGEAGANGITPHIDAGGNWFIGETDTGIPATGPAGEDGSDGAPGLPGEDGANGVTPHIDETSRNWFVGETDTGIAAQGPAGADGSNGITPHIDAGGNWFIGETDTGIAATGPAGTDGTDGTDGAQGLPGADGANGITPHIGINNNWFIGETDTGIPATGPAGTDGADGAQGLPGQDGVDGSNGITPHIDAGGNWFIGETDTGVAATGPAGTDGTDGVQGLPGADGTNGVSPHIDETTGNWFIGETDTGIAAQGPAGNDGQDGAQGVAGQDGVNGTSSYTYWAYASDASGTGFSLTTDPSDALYWMAMITVAEPLTPPVSSDFAGATWVKYRYTPDEFIEILSAAPSDPAAADIGRVFLFAGTTTESFTANHLYRAVSAGGAGGYLVSGAGKTEVNGVYTDSGQTWNGQPVYTFVNGETTYYLYYQHDDDPTYAWVIYNAKRDSDGGDFYAYYQCKSAIDGTWSNSETGSNKGALPAPTVGVYTPYAWEDVTAAFVRSALGINTEDGLATKVLSEKGTFVDLPEGGGGADGSNGTDGVTPHIGVNGNWFIGETDTGIPATGPAGEDGADGADGSNGTDGVSITWLGTLASAPAEPTVSTAYYNSTAKQAYIWDGDSWETLCKDGTDGQDGADGVSIFQQDITPLTGTPVSVSAGGVYSWTISAASVVNKGTWSGSGLEYAIMMITVESGGSLTGGTGITLVDALFTGFNYCILRSIGGAVKMFRSPE